MPRLMSIPDQPEGVGTAMGNQVRTEILRRLSREPMTAPELGDSMGVSRFSVLRHLTVLEDHGLVGADRPAGERKGVTVHWSTDRAQVAAFGARWTAYATGE